MIFLTLQIILMSLLAMQVKSQGGAVPKNVSQIRYGRVNVKDRIAYDLNDIFGAKKREEGGTDKYFMVNNKASRVISSDPFTIREFKEDCTHFNTGHHNNDARMFTIICEKNKFFEISVLNHDSQIAKSPTGIQFLAELKDTDHPNKKLTCYDSTYYYAKQLYGVVCESETVGDTAGDVYIFLVRRIEEPGNVVRGEQISFLKVDKADKISFSQKRLIKMVNFPMGNVFKSEEQFMLYDEPYIYQGHQTTSKDNLFFIIASVEGEKGKEKFVLDKGGINRNTRNVKVGELGKPNGSKPPQIEEFKDLYRAISFESIHGMLVVSGYFDSVTNYVSSLKCEVDTSNPDNNFHITRCKKLPTKYKSDLAFMQFFQNRQEPKIKRVATYSRRTKKIRICNFNISPDYKIDDSNFEDKCAEVKARSTYVKDIAFGYFDNCDNYETCDAVWYDEKKEHFIGVDRYKFIKDETEIGKKYGVLKAKLKQKYFCYGNSGRMIGDNMFMAEEKFISGFNNQRSEEVLIRAELLPPGEDFYVTLYKSQAGTHEFINITGYRVKQMIYQITGKQKFPKFRGSLGEMYHVPLGRDYFNGNALTFKLNANKDIAEDSHIHYQLPGKIYIEKESPDHRMFFYGHKSSVVVTSTWELYFLRCLRKLEKGAIAMNCDKITKKIEGKFTNQALGKGHNLLGDHEGQEMHYVGTDKGYIYRYNRKTKEITEALKFGGNKDKFLEVTFKEYGNKLIVAMLSESNIIYFGKMGLFDDLNSGEIGKPMNKYENKKSSQESPGKFCPNSIYFSQTYESHLVIVNSCKPDPKDKTANGSDRRILTFEVTPTSYEMVSVKNEIETRNEFIRLRDLNGDKLGLCTDKKMNFVANIGTNKAYGIGIATENMVQDLGLDELNVLVIHKLLCLGRKAIGLVVTDNMNRLTVITYFLGKMKDADNRVHSYFHLEGTFKDAVASEGDGLVFYNIKTNENIKDVIMAVDLKGPDVYIKSKVREVAYETEIEVRNKRENQKFDILVEFEKLVKTGGVSHRELAPSIKQKVYENVEKFTYWHGPVWSISNSKDGAGAIVETRLSPSNTWVESETKGLKVLSVDQVQYIDDKVFMLAQTNKDTVIIVKDDMAKNDQTSVIKLGKNCQGLRVTMNFMDKVPIGYLFLTNCHISFIQATVEGKDKLKVLDGPHPRMTYFKLNKVEIKDIIEPADIVFNAAKDFPSVSYDIVYLKKSGKEKKKRILDAQEQGLIQADHTDRILDATQQNEIMICFIHKHNRTMFMSYFIHGQNTAKKFELHDLYRDENVHKIRLLDPGHESNLIFALYYRIGDNSIRLKMINKAKASIEDRDRLIVDRNDGTSFADFECSYEHAVKGKVNERDDLVACVFATNGPYLYKVVYERNIFAGLIFKSRTKYELFSDNHPIKVCFNDRYIAVVTTKASNQKTKLLIYRDSQKDGSRYLYAGIDLDIESDMPSSDFDMKITNDNHLVITINKETKLVYTYIIRDMKIIVKNVEELDNLKENYVKFNYGSDYPPNKVPFKYFFVHLSNQRDLGLKAGGNLWGWIALISFVVGSIIASIFIKRNINKQKDLIRDSGVTNNDFDNGVVHDESIVGLKEDLDDDVYGNRDGDSFGSNGSSGDVKFQFQAVSDGFKQFAVTFQSKFKY